MKPVSFRNLAVVCLLFITSAVMLTVIQPPLNYPLLAWVSLVPFIIACVVADNIILAALAAFIVSACYWLANLYWIGPVTYAGWFAFCLYTALLWPLLLVTVRFAYRKKIPLFLTCAVLFLGAERLQGLFLGGFYWRLLAHSQYQNINLIQIADIFGAGGISFLVAMVNGLIAELIISVWQKNIFKFTNAVKIGLIVILLVATIQYGHWRLKQSPQCVQYGPLAASVQSNVPQTVKITDEPASDKAIFDDLWKNSKAASQTGAKLIVWPETMVQGVLDKRVLVLIDPCSIHNIFDSLLKQHAKEDNLYLLVGATGGNPHIKKNGKIELERYNSAFFYTPLGEQYPRQYNKIHLVPFGEVVPFKKNAPWLHHLLTMLTPYDFDYSLEYGNDYTIFEVADGNEPQKKVYKFGVMICYEDTIPYIARNFCLDRNGKKQIDWLVNISNDGWFVNFTDKGIFPSTELSQHAAICVFRAVENRLAILRSVNTGVSCLIDTTGQIKDDFEAGTLPYQAMERRGIAGWFADKMPIDKRITVFSRFGGWLDISCAISLVFVFVVSCIERILRKNN